MPAQDPDELFDLCDADGRPLGVAKARAAVHRDGDWHRSLHVWVALAEPAGWRVVFQRRSRAKDTWPGRVDIAVTGHYRHGEGLAEALREADEELGLPLGVADVVRLGLRRKDDRGGVAVRDRELQDVYLALRAEPLAALRPDPDELDAVLSVALDDARAQAEGRAARVTAWELRPGEAAPRAVTLDAGEYIPDGDGYRARALAAVAARCAGAAPEPWVLG